MPETPMDPNDSGLDVESEAPREDGTGPLALEPDELVGRTILDRYRILQRIGEGGMGAVYLALHTIIEKKVVLKVLHGEYGRKPELVERFLHEAKTASRIRHENVVDITDFGQIPGGTVFIAMEYLKGQDVSEFIKDHGPLKWKLVKPIALQICAALEEAHNVGVIHRDLKPENIFLIKRGAREDFVKILDFGIAKMTELDESGKRLTRTGMVFGTPEYMAPEQARGEKTDRRVDIYAMGCILYEMMCGDVPFRAQSFMGVLTKHIFDPVVRPSERYPELNVPPRVEAVILKALDKDKERRYQSMAELAAALEAVDSEAKALAAAAARMAASGSQPAMRHMDSSPTLPAAGVAAGGRTAAQVVVEDDADWAPPKRTGLKVGLALGGLVLAGGIAAWVLLGGKKTGAGAGAGSGDGGVAAGTVGGSMAGTGTGTTGVEVDGGAPVVRKINIVTVPAGAVVNVAGEVVGKTPLVVELVTGQDAKKVTLSLVGFKDSVLDVTPDKDREYMVTLDDVEVIKKGGGSGKKGGGKKGGGKKGGGNEEIKDPFGP